MSDRRTGRSQTGPRALALALLIGSSALVGTARGAPPKLSCPPEMALVGQSCVDRWEGSLVEVHADGTETRWTPYFTPMGHVVRAVSQPGVVPQGHISMAIAWGACRKSGKRLCHEKEWLTACRGAQNVGWPYGPTRIPGQCIDFGRTHSLQKLHPGDDMYENRTMNDPRLNQVENTVALTGSAPLCTNETGVFDMVGNLNEWIDDQTMRGGFYLDVEELGQGCGYATKAHSKVYNDYSTGFRCCKDADVEPEPDSCPVDYREGVLDRFLDLSTAIAPFASFVAALAMGSTIDDVAPEG